MSTLEVNAPYSTGAPGRTSWVSAIPNRASAFCCTSAAASVTGAMAPISVNGVTDTGWPCSAIVIRPLAISESKRRGELTLMMVVTPGDLAISSRVQPRLMAIILMPSRARPRPIEVQWYDRSDSTRLAR